MPETLWRRWWRLMAAGQVHEAAARQEFEQLVQAYSSEGRFYHTLAHIQQVLTTMDQLKSHVSNRAIAELGAWFHDVVYEPQASDNEANSAAYAIAAMQRMGLPESWRSPVQQLILATGSHLTNFSDSSIAVDPDMQVLLDADLAILGSPPRHYAAYARAIRQEYAWVPNDRYRQGRSQILHTFLQRQPLYFTPPMQALIPQAHINLQTEIHHLTAASP